MIEISIQFFLSAVAIVLAGVFLVRSTDRISELTRLGRLFTGSIFLAGATSLPELLVDINAIRKSMPDLAVGDLMGSSLMNLLILAVADLFHRNPNKIFSKAGAQHALAAALSIHMTGFACLAIYLEPFLPTISLGGAGIGPLAIMLAYILGLRLMYFEQKTTFSHSKEMFTRSQTGLGSALSVYLASALVIFVAAPFLAEAAGQIADGTGLGKTFIGSSLVALCTSLPELVSTLAALRMGALDLAVGNIFGSNSFNMILLFPLDIFHEGNLLSTVSRTHILTGLSVIVASSIAMMGQLYQSEKRRIFVEPDAFGVISIVLGSLLMLYWLGQS